MFQTYRLHIFTKNQKELGGIFIILSSFKMLWRECLEKRVLELGVVCRCCFRDFVRCGSDACLRPLLRGRNHPNATKEL